MSKIHILDASENQGYNTVVHTAVPTGSNSASKTWKDVCLAAGESVTTQLTEGTGVGQITTAEKASVEAGDTLEFSFNILAESSGATSASITAMINEKITNKKLALKRKYKFFGYTQD